jgi:hypothetical protein
MKRTVMIVVGVIVLSAANAVVVARSTAGARIRACDTKPRSGLTTLEFVNSDNLTQELTVSPIGYCRPPLVFVSLQREPLTLPPYPVELSAAPFGADEIQITARLGAIYTGEIRVYWQVIPIH